MNSFLIVIITVQFFLPFLSFQDCQFTIVDPQNAEYEQEFLVILNDFREQNGMNRLEEFRDLSNVARYHSCDMKRDRYYDHDSYSRIDGELVYSCKWNERIAAFVSAKRLYAGENITISNSPLGAFNSFEKSPGHRQNMLGNYSWVGIGYCDSYWTIDFFEPTDKPWKIYFPVVIQKH
jgi:uncharacterized protein YkwD